MDYINHTIPPTNFKNNSTRINIVQTKPYSKFTNITSPQQNLEVFFKYIKSHDIFIQLILFIVGIVITGEAINSITSKIAKISPIKKKVFLKAYVALKK